MSCSLTERYNWCKDFPTVYKDEEGKEFCIFHAPVGKKGKSLDEFNKTVFKELDKAKQLGIPCNLSGTIFEGNIRFKLPQYKHLPPIIIVEAEFNGIADFSETAFGGDVSFAKTIFKEGVNFERSVFESSANFVETSLEGANFTETIFKESVNFIRAEFKGAFFSGAMFNKKAKFSEVKFEGIADFLASNFNEFASFSVSVFKELANFSKAKFNDAGFSNTIFKEALFQGTIFNNVSFIHATLEKADFSDTIIKGITNFSEAITKKYINFTDATFNGEVNFLRSTFNGEIYFPKVMFTKAVNFSEVTFNGPTGFSSSIFKEKADFSRTHYSIEAFFTETTFIGEANFREAVFSRGALFIKTTFNEVADFSKAIFNKMAYFTGATFNKKVYFRAHTFNNGALLYALNFRDKIRFEGVNLQKVSFLDTDVKDMDFINCIWHKKIGRHLLYDEIRLFHEKDDKNIKTGREYDKPENVLLTGKPEKKSKQNLAMLQKEWNDFKHNILLKREKIKKVEILYRKLKQKYKEEHNEPEVSNWHYGEKEMFRKGSYFRRFNPVSLSNLYWLSSGYGERPVRAGIVLFLLIITISILFGLACIEQISPEGFSNVINIQTWNDISWGTFKNLLLSTFQYVIFDKNPDYVPKEINGNFLKIFAQIIIPLQAALFALAIRNRFRR